MELSYLEWIVSGTVFVGSLNKNLFQRLRRQLQLKRWYPFHTEISKI
jgi:hypothetical protein